MLALYSILDVAYTVWGGVAYAYVRSYTFILRLLVVCLSFILRQYYAANLLGLCCSIQLSSKQRSLLRAWAFVAFFPVAYSCSIQLSCKAYNVGVNYLLVVIAAVAYIPNLTIPYPFAAA